MMSCRDEFYFRTEMIKVETSSQLAEDIIEEPRLLEKWFFSNNFEFLGVSPSRDPSDAKGTQIITY
jgi:hypothetical protein